MHRHTITFPYFICYVSSARLNLTIYRSFHVLSCSFYMSCVPFYFLFIFFDTSVCWCCWSFVYLNFSICSNWCCKWTQVCPDLSRVRNIALFSFYGFQHTQLWNMNWILAEIRWMPVRAIMFNHVTMKIMILLLLFFTKKYQVLSGTCFKSSTIEMESDIGQGCSLQWHFNNVIWNKQAWIFSHSKKTTHTQICLHSHNHMENCSI